MTFQSTLNRERGIGVFSILLQDLFCVVTSFSLTKYSIVRFGCKPVMLMSGFTFLPYIVANYYPVDSLILLSSVPIAVGFTLFVGAADSYINELSFLFYRLCCNEAAKSVGVYGNLSKDLKRNDVICTSYEKVDSDKIRTLPQEMSGSKKKTEDTLSVGNIENIRKNPSKVPIQL